MRIYRVVWEEDGARHSNQFSSAAQAQEFVGILQAELHGERLARARNIVIERIDNYEPPAPPPKPKLPERRSAWDRLSDDDAF